MGASLGLATVATKLIQPPNRDISRNLDEAIVVADRMEPIAAFGSKRSWQQMLLPALRPHVGRRPSPLAEPR